MFPAGLLIFNSTCPKELFDGIYTYRKNCFFLSFSEKDWKNFGSLSEILRWVCRNCFLCDHKNILRKTFFSKKIVLIIHGQWAEIKVSPFVKKFLADLLKLQSTCPLEQIENNYISQEKTLLSFSYNKHQFSTFCRQNSGGSVKNWLNVSIGAIWGKIFPVGQIYLFQRVPRKILMKNIFIVKISFLSFPENESKISICLSEEVWRCDENAFHQSIVTFWWKHLFCEI